MEILEGTFIPPKGTDPATLIILNEIARIYKLMGEDEVSIIVTKEDFQYYWKRVKERTVLSYLLRPIFWPLQVSSTLRLPVGSTYKASSADH